MFSQETDRAMTRWSGSWFVILVRGNSYLYRVVKERFLAEPQKGSRFNLSTDQELVHSLRMPRLAIRRLQSIGSFACKLHAKRQAGLEAIGIEPTTSGLQSRRSPS